MTSMNFFSTACKNNSVQVSKQAYFSNPGHTKNTIFSQKKHTLLCRNCIHSNKR